MSKIIVYQVLTRLFGANKKSPVPDGSREQSGCGTMSDFTTKALEQIKTRKPLPGVPAPRTFKDLGLPDIK